MIEIAKITNSSIELKGVSFSDGEKIQEILEICHRTKHMYLEGYPCGRKTRLANKQRLKKWSDYPGICFTYVTTNDNKEHNVEIRILASNMEKLLERYTKKQIEYYSQKYIQDVANEIAKLD